MDRRTALGTLAGLGTAVLAGCAGRADDDDDPATATSSTATEQRATGERTRTERGTRVRLTAVTRIPPDATAVVYPPALREWLATAATTDRRLRVFDETHVPNPDPIWPDVTAVTLDGAASGTYRLDATGGTRYELLVGADRVDPPDDATVIPVAELSDARREVTLAAIRGERARVFPETRLGEWVRTTLFGGYVRHDGDTYRGFERRQTDAAFFSDRVWYVLRAERAEPPDPVSLTLDSVPDAVRDLLDPLLADSKADRTLTTPPSDDPAVRAFAADTAYLCTHTRRFRVDAV